MMNNTAANSSFADEVRDFFINLGLGFLVFALIIVIGTLLVKLVLKIIGKVLDRPSIDNTVKTFIISVLKVVLYAVVVITALGSIGIDLSSVIAAVGAAALTAGLALQETIKNFVSGIIILVSKPFTAGDTLEYDGFTGVVKSINIFYTTILTITDRTIQVPNSKLTDNTVVNCTFDGLRRMKLTYSVGYETDFDRLQALMFELIKTNGLIHDSPEPTVQVGKFLDSGLEIVVQVWIKSEDYFKVYYFMQEEVKKMFDKNGITIPYPHVVVKN